MSFAFPGGTFQLAFDALELAAGETAACIGPSGTGKTTLLYLLCGITLPQAGRVRIDDVDVTGLDDDRRRALRIRRVGLVFQHFALLDHLSVLDNLLLPYHVSGALHLDAEVRESARELGRRLGLGDKLGRSPARLSHGERQRVAIGRALVTHPPLVLCDEPTGNLDPRTKDSVLDLLFEELGARGATLLMVTHDHSTLDRFDRVIDMQELSPPR